MTTSAPRSAAPRLLAFDTSTETMSVVVVGAPGGPVGWNGPGGAAASAGLIPRVHELLRGAGLALADLDAIGFGAGPGAFTGLRSACAVAQGLAWGLGRPVLPIDSLALVAEDAAWHDGEPVWVAMDARMDEVYAAEFRWDGNRWAAGEGPLTAPALWPVAALAERWSADPPRRVAGSALRAFAERLLPAGVSTTRRPDELARAAALGRCAAAAWSRGEAVDPAAALPVYLRDQVALTTAQRAAAAAARTAAAAA